MYWEWVIFNGFNEYLKKKSRIPIKVIPYLFFSQSPSYPSFHLVEDFIPLIL